MAEPGKVARGASVNMEPKGTSESGRHGSVVIADGDEQSRTAAAKILSEGGLRVILYDPQSQLYPFLIRRMPDVLLLDADLPQVDTLTWLRESQSRQPAGSMEIILLCPPVCDKARLQAYVRAGVTGIVVKPPTREALLPRTIDAVKKVRAFKQRLRKPSGEAPARPAAEGTRRPPNPVQAPDVRKKAAQPVKGNSSLLEREVLCPFHEEPSAFNRYTLRTGRIVTDSSFFDVPVYLSANKGADFVNYHLLNVMVCPQCFFASNNAEYFIHPGDEKHQPYAFKPVTRTAIVAAAEDRRKLAAGISPEFFTEKRTPEDAVISYELALETSRTLWTAGKREFPVELIRMANYQLRIAHVREVMKLPVPAGDDRYAAAFELLKEAFQTVEGANLYRTIYQLIAVAIYLGCNADAMRYMEHIRVLQREAKVPQEDVSALQRYANRCRKAWEDRDMHRASPTAAPPTPASTPEAGPPAEAPMPTPEPVSNREAPTPAPDATAP
jgi:CheY-like chemotaxis protein